MDKDIIIKGKRIYFRKLTDDDASQEYSGWLNDPIVNKYLETREATIDDLKKYINDRNKDTNCAFFGIFVNENDKHIGNIKLEPIDFKDKRATLGILIGDKEYWGKGIGTEATEMLAKYAFDKLKLESINLGVISENKKAIGVYKKVGFDIIGVEKGKVKHGDKYYDRVVMEIKKKNDKKIVCAIIQARMGSTRLPGKMMMILKDKPLIHHVLDRVNKTKLIDKVILATSEDKNNEDLIEEVKKKGFDVFVGSENDVLDRYYQCAKKFNAGIVVRITGDCPLVDPEIIDKVIELFKKNDIDYASNVHPPIYPDGMDVEVFSFSALEKAWKEAKLTSEREHVTPYIWKNKKLFKQVNLKNNKHLSNLRLTVDEKEDLVFLNELLKKIDSDDPSLKDLIKVIKENPTLLKINNTFERNEGYQKSIEEDKNDILLGLKSQVSLKGR